MEEQVISALVDTIFYDKTEAYEDEECQVKINGDRILISYEEEDSVGYVNYVGKDEGYGHFVLECPEKNGKATLHQIPGSKFLEGYWKEEGNRGFWRIKLP